MRFSFLSCLLCLLIGLLAPLTGAEPAGAAPEPAATEAAAEPSIDAGLASIEEAPPVKEKTLLDTFNEGGWPMYVLLLLAILGLGICMERFVNLNRGKVAPRGFLALADKLWQAGDYEALTKLCKQDGSTLANTIHYCVVNRGDGLAAINEGAGEIASRDFRKHLQTNYWLAVVATLSPLLGLLGTILGMIESFEMVALLGEIGDVSQVAGGISKALVTTAFGLIVAVPALAAYHYFKGKVTQLAIVLEDEIALVMKKWFDASAVPSSTDATQA